MSEWWMAVWLVGMGLFSPAGRGPASVDVAVCHVRTALGGAFTPPGDCPCGEICDDDAKDDDAKDDDAEDEDVRDGCDPEPEPEDE